MKPDTPWIKSSRSGGNGGDCVELRRHRGSIQIRDSKARDTGPTLHFAEATLHAFLAGVKSGDFDRA